jgi:hypothetical protein
LYNNNFVLDIDVVDSRTFPEIGRLSVPRVSPPPLCANKSGQSLIRQSASHSSRTPPRLRGPLFITANTSILYPPTRFCALEYTAFEIPTRHLLFERSKSPDIPRSSGLFHSLTLCTGLGRIQYLRGNIRYSARTGNLMFRRYSVRACTRVITNGSVQPRRQHSALRNDKQNPICPCPTAKD